EPLEGLLGLADRATLQVRRHHRRRRLGDRAPGPQEADLADHPVLDPELDPQLVAAERVHALRPPGGRGHGAEVPWPPVVVEDHLLVELLELGHQPKISGTRRRARPSASTSSSVLYRANEARTAAGTRNRCITGIAQWCPVRTATPSRSRMVPTSWACTPSTTNERTLALSRAVPMSRTPGTAATSSVARARISCSHAAAAWRPTALRYSSAAPSPMAPAMWGVPASRRYGRSL